MTARLDVPVSAWLGQLLDEVDELAAALATTPDHDLDAALDAARDAAAIATLRLDGSPIEQLPPPLDALDAAHVGTVTGPARGGWLEVLRAGAQGLEEAPDEVVLALEHRGARLGLDADDLTGPLTDDPLAALATLHRRVTEGLLSPETAGAPRRTTQAVHDASIGRIVFFPVDAAHVAPRMDALATWLAGAGEVHPVIASGVLQHQVLDVHPYEAANGRTARIAARLLLAGAGIDVARVGQPEQALLEDAIGYLDEVAHSRRLGDPGAFVARWAEALVAGLLTTATALGVAPGAEVPAGTAAFLAERGAEPFTVVDHREAVGGGPAADAALDAARRAGLAVRLLGTRGLRWRAA